MAVRPQAISSCWQLLLDDGTANSERGTSPLLLPGQPKSLPRAWPFGSVLRLLPDSDPSTYCSKTVCGLQGGWGWGKGND